MAECQNCGSFVTKDFVRVFGIEGEIYACMECGGKQERKIRANI